MRKRMKTALAASALALSLGLSLAGGTFAYLTATAAQRGAAPTAPVTTRIVDHHETLEGKNAQVENTGEIDCLVRVRVNINFLDLARHIDLTDLGSGWVYSAADDWYYYKKVLSPGEVTPAVFREITFEEDVNYKGLVIAFTQESVQATLYGAGADGGDISAQSDGYAAVWAAAKA